MNNGSNDRGIDKIRDCVIWAIDQSMKHVNNICPPREKWTWERLVSLGPKNDDKKTNKIKKLSEINREKIHDLKNNYQDNANEETIKWNANCCYIKIQDPCAACCCESNSHLPSTCPDGPRIAKKYPKCGCYSTDTKHVEACCEACKNRLHSV